MSFTKEVKEFTSPSNYISIILAFAIMVATSEKRFLAFVWAFALFILLSLTYFLLRWIFVYRKEKLAWDFI